MEYVWRSIKINETRARTSWQNYETSAVLISPDYSFPVRELRNDTGRGFNSADVEGEKKRKLCINVIGDPARANRPPPFSASNLRGKCLTRINGGHLRVNAPANSLLNSFRSVRFSFWIFAYRRWVCRCADTVREMCTKSEKCNLYFTTIVEFARTSPTFIAIPHGDDIPNPKEINWELRATEMLFSLHYSINYTPLLRASL